MLTRRGFAAAAVAAPLSAQRAYATTRSVAEFSFASSGRVRDPFRQTSLDVVFTDPTGAEQRVPAFWAGGDRWTVRHAPEVPGVHRYRTLSNDASLDGRQAALEVEPYRGSNPLLERGAMRISKDRRHFEHADGTPFFWLADTWWMGLSRRLEWPDEFQSLTADRVRKGFSVIQIIAGLYPDMPQFDPRGLNEAGFPWENDYARINPAYFDMADLRIRHLVSQGLTPCIVGCWGYFLPMMGIDNIKAHWRYLIARWAAYPVVWCLAGEGTMPYYLSKTPKEDAVRQKEGWTEIARYVRATDPFHRVITIHPSQSSRATVTDPSAVDFDMLQTGHSDRQSYANTIESVAASYRATPAMPVLVGEACYEGIMEASREEVQRYLFWASVLSGSAGHTYGANGLWQLNRAGAPYGPSPHGRSWGDTPWDVAAALPGSKQLGWSKHFLMRYPWWRFEPHPEWVEPRWKTENYQLPFAAGVPGEARVIFIPPAWNPPKLLALEAGVKYRAMYFSPATGAEKEIGVITAADDGTWQAPITPTFADWVIGLRREGV